MDFYLLKLDEIALNFVDIPLKFNPLLSLGEPPDGLLQILLFGLDGLASIDKSIVLGLQDDFCQSEVFSVSLKN